MHFQSNLSFYLTPHLITEQTELGEIKNARGLAYKLIKIFCEQPGIFCKFYNAYGNTDVGNYSVGVLGGDFIINEDSKNLFCTAYGADDLTFVTAKPMYVTSAMGIFKTFSGEVWLSLLFTILVVAVIHFLTFQKKDLNFSSFFHISSDCVGQHHDWKPKTAAQKTIVLSWMTGIAILIFSYQSVLLSFLTVPAREKGVKNIDDLYKAVREGRYTVTSVEDSKDPDNFIKSTSGKMHFIGEHAINQARVPKSYAILEFLRKRNLAVIGSRTFFSPLSVAPDIFISEDSLSFTLYAHIVFTYDSEHIKKRINKFISRIWSSGINKHIDKRTRFTLEQVIRNHYKGTFSMEEPVRSLTINDLSCAFFILLIGLLLGVICLFFELRNEHRYS